MSERNIVNIINFIRAEEPRDPSLDLVEPVVNQIRLCREHNLPGTWLVQYDALLELPFVDLLRDLDERHEIGAWFEVMQCLVEEAGLPWRGRPGYSWDWHADCGFSVGYTPTERERISDVFMGKFREVFGYYPRSVGSWLMDAHLLGYLSDRYGIIASCTCKDQWGTDGYTLWGGYYSQAFYPSRKNAFMPAQHETDQIPVPVFRMLGSDPIYQYDLEPDENGRQLVMTLEPVYKDGGGCPTWVDWFFDVTFGAPSISFGYAQVGQENPFGWPLMADGLEYQIPLIARKAAAGEITVETLADSAAWFRSRYPVTPSSAITALSDWKNEGRKAVWYCSRFYRASLLWDRSGFQVRDIHLFDEDYPERYLTGPCTEHFCTYDTLPVLDGLLWSDKNRRAGVRLYEQLPDGSRRYLDGEPEVREDGEYLRVRWESYGVTVEIDCAPAELAFRVSSQSKPVPWGMEVSWGTSKETALQTVDGGELRFTHNGHSYAVRCSGGEFAESAPASVDIIGVGDQVAFIF